ncbi:hypothetical protein SCHPADRAFT_530148 [Schizopora paradoxa]|uniref:F-box domain-containing protein n=1 Tax=Schizopora paradoxa TaxID=27342 RepID=A0A0H2RED7_9AGAM|nr:hypothetical protein SCHPADRAFT_530148 [Schizopora paradoxa]
MELSAKNPGQIIISALEGFAERTKATRNEPLNFPWPFRQFASQLSDDTDYVELRSNLRVAESVEELLQRMLTSASAVVADLKPKFNDMANRRKFRTLPDEILAIVIEMAYSSLYDGLERLWMLRDLSSVSRRFRRIVIGLPILWSDISSVFLDHKHIKLFASRVSIPAISFSLDGGMEQKPKESEQIYILGAYRLAISGTISSRIRSLRIRISDTDVSYLQKIIQICSNVSLPVLSELYLGSRCEIARQCQSLCYDWSMPSINKLHVVDFLPNLPSCVLSRISSCSIEANRDLGEEGDGWRGEEILVFLLSLTAVKDLLVAVCFFDFLDEFKSKGDHRMDSVESLVLVLQSMEVAVDENIIDVVKFPSITTFKLDLGLGGIEHIDQVLRDIKFMLPPTSITDVTLTTGIEYESYYKLGPPMRLENGVNHFEV